MHLVHELPAITLRTGRKIKITLFNMNKRKKRLLYGVVIGMVVLVCLFFYRFELMFAFQRMQLAKMGCGSGKSVVISTRPDLLRGCEKLWVHRVNSSQRFQYMKDQFSGLETDVVFDKKVNNFRVYHPPAPPSGLLLDEYFKQLKAGAKGLWVDVKGIDTTCWQQAVDYFEACDRLYDIKKFVIIESSEIPFVNLLASRGFLTSFLVPVQFVQAETPVRVTDSVAQQLSPAVKFVSQEDRFLPALRSRFHNRKIITWALTFSNYVNLSHFRSLINDTSISVVLINCKSSHYL